MLMQWCWRLPPTNQLNHKNKLLNAFDEIINLPTPTSLLSAIHPHGVLGFWGFGVLGFRV